MKSHNSRNNAVTPTSATNRWKIPHYYRRSNSKPASKINASKTNVIKSSSSDISVQQHQAASVTMPTSQFINENGNSPTMRRADKKKSGEMVFVNYTVQDNNTNNAVEKEEKTIKKKSSRSRMLKMFGSSSHSDHHESSSFLKYPRFHHHDSSSSSSSFFDNDNYSIPDSINSINQEYECSRGLANRDINVDENRPAVKIPLFNTRNVPKSRSNSNGQNTYHNQQQTNSLAKVDNSSVVSFESNLYNSTAMAATTMSSSHSSSSNSNAIKHNTENDATVAFNKIFSGSNGGKKLGAPSLSRSSHHMSMSSLTSLSNTSITQNASSSNNSNSNNNVTKYSPIRTVSPARPRSRTRGSSINRISKDMGVYYHSAHGSVSDIPESFSETYLDNAGTLLKQHRRQQPSISELNKISSVSSSSLTSVVVSPSLLASSTIPTSSSNSTSSSARIPGIMNTTMPNSNVLSRDNSVDDMLFATPSHETTSNVINITSTISESISELSTPVVGSPNAATVSTISNNNTISSQMEHLAMVNGIIRGHDHHHKRPQHDKEEENNITNNFLMDDVQLLELYNIDTSVLDNTALPLPTPTLTDPNIPSNNAYYHHIDNSQDISSSSAYYHNDNSQNSHEVDAITDFFYNNYMTKP